MKKLLSLIFCFFVVTVNAQVIENIHPAYGTNPITLNQVKDCYGDTITKVDVTMTNSSKFEYNVPLKVSTCKSYKPYNNLLDFGYHASFNFRDTYYYGGQATFIFISNETGHKYQAVLGLGQYQEKGYILPTIMSNLGSHEPAYGRDDRNIYIEAEDLTSGQQAIFKVSKGKDSVGNLRFTFLFNKNPNEELLNLYLPWAFNSLSLDTKLNLFDYQSARNGKTAATFNVNTIDVEKLAPESTDVKLISSSVTNEKDVTWTFVGDNSFVNNFPTKQDYQTSEFNKSMTSTITVTNTNSTCASRTTTYKITLPTKADLTQAQTINYTYTRAVADAEAITQNYVAKSQKVTIDAGCTGIAKVYMGFGRTITNYQVSTLFTPDTRVFATATKLNTDHTDTNYYGSFNFYEMMKSVAWKPQGITFDESKKSVKFVGYNTVTNDNSVLLKVVTTQVCPDKPPVESSNIVAN